MIRRIFAVALVAATFVTGTGLVAAPGNHQGNGKQEMFGKGRPFTIGDLPRSRVRERVESLAWTKRQRALEWLHRFDFPQKDLEELEVDDEGAVLYVDPAPLLCEDLQCEGEDLPVDGALAPAADPADPSTAASSADDAFVLHSRPSAQNVVFLDFDGHSFSGTAWGGGTYYAEAFDLDGNPANFNAAERAAIAEIWHRVAEDFAPFDIDVTTEEPASFGPYTGRVLITSKRQTNGQAMPYDTAGGVAYVGVWGRSDYASNYSPALVYYDNLANNATYIAEASAHEFGHNLGLSHDGTGSVSYYAGHGSGATSWAPIMGNSYSRNVTQWSKGEYAGANNTQDDIAVITDALFLVADDHGATPATATALSIDGSGEILVSDPEIDPHNLYPDNKGVIDSVGDWDHFAFYATSGTVDIRVNPSWQAFYRDSRRGANLDIRAVLLDAGGNIVAESDPDTDTYAGISAAVTEGFYYLAVTGVGNGNYSTYASQGQYFISGTVPADPNTPPTADFGSACQGLTCSFVDSSSDSDGSIASWSWSFGDGASATAQSPTHSYSAAGTYTVTLTVTDDDGEIAATSADVQVTDGIGSPPPADVINFNDFPLSSFSSNQDGQGTASIEDGGVTLRLVGNTWKRIDFPYTVGPQTVIEFDFYSGSRGEIHGIGFEEDNGLTAGRIFKLYGSQAWGVRDFDNYPGSGWVHYSIPAGEFYAGSMNYLVFTMDHDSGGNGESRFRNVRVHEGSSSPMPPVVTPPADISTEATAVLTPVALGTATSDDGSAVSNNAPADGFPLGTTVVTWSATDTAGNTGTATQSVTIVDSTPPQLTVPPDITTAPGGDIGSATASDIFPVTVTNNAPASLPPGVTVVTWIATDTSGNSNTATQRVTVENVAPPPADVINFNDFPLSSFSSNQDGQGTASIEDGGVTLRLVGNTWKRIDFPYTVGPQTVIEFDFYSGSRGEIHGIGFEEDNGLTAGRIFKLYGSQAWGVRDFDNYPGSGWVHYSIPAGEFYTGSMNYLVFTMDHDSGGNGESRFRNVRISQ